MQHSYSIEREAVPNTSLKFLRRLGKTLLRDRPLITNQIIDISLYNLEAEIELVGKAMVNRLREVNPQLIVGEVTFDRGGDVNWVWLRKLLEGFRDAWGHPGLDLLPPALQAQAKLPELRARATAAGKLHARLFGAEGTNWVKSNFIEQSQTMATILDMIESDGLRPELEAVVGPEQPLLLETIQIHYEAMVGDRMTRQNRPTNNFDELRAKLRWRIDHYKSAVENLRNPEEPGTYELVRVALRSLILTNQRIAKGGIASGQGDDVLVEDDLMNDVLVEDESIEGESSDPSATPEDQP